MKRIFYYSGYRFSIFHWENNKCIACYAFHPDDNGFEKFTTYLKATSNTPARILLDLIEEDFNKETIPHVGIVDRKAIVKRLINRQYRKSKDYFYYKITGREKSGRKDDKLLYSVLSNPDILTPWLNIIKSTDTAISGMWSLPLLSEKIFSHINATAKNILIVSQQVPRNLRQTLLIDGLFEHSRSGVVNLDDSDIGKYISTEVEQTIRFLSNQRHIGFDDKIEIHIICRKNDINNIKENCMDKNLLSFHYHSLTEIENSLKCHTHTADIDYEHKAEATIEEKTEEKIDYSNGIYSYICASVKLPIGHYGSLRTFSAYYQQLSSIGLKISSALIFLCSTLFSLSYITESYIYDNETITLNKQASAINKNYQKQIAGLEHALNLTQVMQSSVLLTEKIRENKSVSPQNFMVDVSRILTRPIMSNTQISKVTWKKHQFNNFLPKNNKLKQEIDYGKKEPVNHLATLSGFIRVSEISLKKAVDKTNAIAAAFNKNSLINKVRLNKVPVDVRSKSSIENENINSQEQNAKNDNIRGRFEIEVIMDARKS